MDQFAYAAHMVGSMSTGIEFGPLRSLVDRVTLFRTTATLIYNALDFDIAIRSKEYLHLSDPRSFPKSRLYQAASLSGVRRVDPFYIELSQWRNPQNGNDWRDCEQQRDSDPDCEPSGPNRPGHGGLGHQEPLIVPLGVPDFEES